jgi:hypothetical protein
MVTGKETSSFSKQRSDFSHDCMVARTRERGRAILNRNLHRGHPSSLAIGAPGKRLSITYKSIPVLDLVYAQPFDETMLLFYVCPGIQLKPALFAAAGESYSLAEHPEPTDSVQARIRVVLLIQPPTLSPFERAITAMVPGEPAFPTLLPMHDRWAVGGALAHAAIRRQQSSRWQKNEAGSMAPMEKQNNSPLHMHSDSPLSMAALFKAFVASRNSEERI